MERRIELERRGRSPEEIKELNLDSCPSTQITGLTDEYCNLESLSLINVGLTTLEGFPKLPNLKKLELSDNSISGDLNWLHESPKLTDLNLSGNKVKDIKTLMPLGELKNLKNLDLRNCEVTNDPNYRDDVFGFICSLKYLSGYDRNNKETDGSEAEIDEEVDADQSSIRIESSNPSIQTLQNKDIALFEKSTSFSAATTAASGFSFGATSIIGSGIYQFGQNNQQKVYHKRGATVAGFTFGTTAEQTTLVSSLPIPSEFNFGNSTRSTPFFSTSGTESSTAIATHKIGTTIKFNPPVGRDYVMRGGVLTRIIVKYQFITAMMEYTDKSFEELRVEDYAAGNCVPAIARATDCTGFVTCLPAASTSGFIFGNGTESKSLVGTIEKTDIAILQKQFKDLLLSGDDHDVIIKIKNREYKAHKSILRARSPVLSAMFKHQMKENNDNSISIEDCDAEDFGKFLQYIYTGEVENLSPSSALNLYYAGDKYQISGLKAMCVNFLKLTLSTANICSVITLATKHDEADLLQCAILFFAKHLEEILITVDWQYFLTDNPIQANELYIKAVKTSYKKIS